MNKSPLAKPARPWRQALLWGIVLGVLFFTSYGAANHYTAQRSDVGVHVFGWEHTIPFLPWTILPYWSIDFLYGIALFAARSKAELYRLVKRLLAAQAICITGFLLWPLRFSFTRPDTQGWTGVLFDALTGFDLPYNQAPSLHICLLVVLWRFYAERAGQRGIRWLLHTWFALIAVSVLTTYQHHFIDLLTGFWAGALCLLLVPDANEHDCASHSRSMEVMSVSLTPSPSPQMGEGSFEKPLRDFHVSAKWRWRGHEPGRLRLALYYLIGASAAGSIGYALFPHAAAWALYWIAAALAGVGLLYLFGEGAHFGKRAGRMPWRSWMFFGPYLLGARLNAWLWTRKLPVGVEVLDGVFLGRQPDAATLAQHGITHVIDLAAELPLPAGAKATISLPLQDLLPPSRAQLLAVADAIEAARQQGRTWVCCALGFSRSAACVAAWLVRHRAHTPDEAIAAIRRARPLVVLRGAILLSLAPPAEQGEAV